MTHQHGRSMSSLASTYLVVGFVLIWASGDLFVASRGLVNFENELEQSGEVFRRDELSSSAAKGNVQTNISLSLDLPAIRLEKNVLHNTVSDFNPNKGEWKMITSILAGLSTKLSISVPSNMELQEKMQFIESLVCPNSMSPNLTTGSQGCSPFWCYGCSSQYCGQHRDCCLDEAYNDTIEVHPKLPYRNCLTATPKLTHAFNESWYYFTSSCPPSFTDVEIKKKCAERSFDVNRIENYLPVYSNATHENYINVFCARCHNDSNSLQIWQPDVRCREYIDINGMRLGANIMKTAMASLSCMITSLPPEGADYLPCNNTGDIVQTCNETGLWEQYDDDVAVACNRYKSPVVMKHVVARNVFCGICNGFDTPAFTDTLNSSNSTCGEEPTNVRRLSDIAHFSMIFNVSVKSAESAIPGVYECEEDEVYDPYKRSCRDLFCSPGRFINKHTCVEAYQSIIDVGFAVRYLLIPETGPVVTERPLDEAWFEYVQDFVLHSVPVIVDILPRMHNISVGFCWDGNNGNDSLKKIHFVQLLAQIVPEMPDTQRHVEETLLELFNFTWNFANVTWSPKIQTSSVHEQDFINRHKLTCTVYFIEINSPWKTAPWDFHNVSAYNLVNKLTNCDQIELQPDEYRTDNATGDIWVKGPGINVRESDYVVVNNNIRICVNYVGTYEKQSKSAQVLAVNYTAKFLSVISFAVSLTFLFATLLVSLFKQTHQTLPGKITVIFTTTLLLAQTLHLVTGYFSLRLWPCRLLGLLLHYVWLSVFSWNNIAAFHMYTIFTNRLKNAIQHPCTTLAWYTLYGFGTPAILVGCYVSVRAVLSTSGDIGYGGEVCFITRPTDIGLSFVTPMALVFLVNTYFFGRATNVIRQVSKREKTTNRSNSNLIAFFIKTSLLLGFSWIVGFLAVMINHPYLWYAFVCLNGGMGVLISVALFFNTGALKSICKAKMNSDRASIAVPGKSTDFEVITVNPSNSESICDKKSKSDGASGAAPGKYTDVEQITMKLSTSTSFPMA